MKICYLVEETIVSLNDSPEKVFILAARFLSLRDDDRNSKISPPSGYFSDSNNSSRVLLAMHSEKPSFSNPLFATRLTSKCNSKQYRNSVIPNNTRIGFTSDFV
jgi:hypothetical protein